MYGHRFEAFLYWKILMLRLAKLADYGLLIACHLANLPDELVKLEQVADATRLPIPTVRKVMKLLVDQGVVRSERGVKGGYLLSRPADRISIGEVITAVEGGLALTECCQDACLCDVSKACTVQNNWNVINRTVGEIFSRITLADMSRPLTRADVLAYVEARDPNRLDFVAVG